MSRSSIIADWRESIGRQRADKAGKIAGTLADLQPRTLAAVSELLVAEEPDIARILHTKLTDALDEHATIVEGEDG